ncbi:hypothetical protein JCM11641_006866 [Rhodosporidiobolus odoratus]
MGLWIAENSHTLAGHVPGTALLDDLKASGPTQEGAAHLKRDKNGRCLSRAFRRFCPYPDRSDDPRDPLNWPTWKREACYWNIVFATALVGAIGPIISPGFVTIAGEFGVSVNKVAATNAALVLAIGAVMIPVSTIAIKWGRRPVYLWGAVFLLVGSIWSGAEPDLDNLLASRIIQGSESRHTSFPFVLLSAINSLVFSRTYGFTARQTGFVSVSPLIASIIMSLVAGYIADFLAVFMARRNKGVFEPEMRLILMLPYAIFVIFGYVGWAMSYRNHTHWMVPVICYGLTNAGQKFLSIGSVTYVIDVHRAQTSEAQAIINFLKNLISYFIGTKINGWVISVGIEDMFFILAGADHMLTRLLFFLLSPVTLTSLRPSRFSSQAVSLTTIPMYHYGKISRSWVSRHQNLFCL